MTVRTRPVALFLIETCTPGITAPDESVTVPESVAPVTCACTDAAGRRVMAKTKKTERATRSHSEESLICIGPPTNGDPAPRAAMASKPAGKQGPEFRCDYLDFCCAKCTHPISSRH